MKKLALTIAIVFTMALSAAAQEGGLFGLGKSRESANLREGENRNTKRNNSTLFSNIERLPLPPRSGGLSFVGGKGNPPRI